MTDAQATPQHRALGVRLLALLLALLLSVTSLAGHAAMDVCASDCTTAQVDQLEGMDNTDHECTACAALVAIPVIAPTGLDTLAGAFGPAVVEHISLPPRQPPRP